MNIKGRCWSYGQFAMSALVATIALLLSHAATSAIPAQYQCTPEGSASGAACKPVDIGPWRWRAYSLQYNFNVGFPMNQWFSSEAQLTDAIQASVLARSSWCTLSHQSTMPGPSAPLSAHGIVTREYFQPQFEVTAHKTNAVPCNQNWAYTPTIYRQREVSCPTGWNITADLSAGIGAYCACPWGSECAAPVTYKGSMCKGNPCIVMSGNKHQVERDYSGPAGLSFIRSYNSKYAYAYNHNSNNRFEPLGIGWAASYFQRLAYGTEGHLRGLWAYRPDGSVLGYTEVAPGVFEHGGEIADRVERVLDANGDPIGWKYVTAGDDIEQYDLAGKLESITSRAGIVQALSYDVFGALSAVTDSFGRSLGFTWNADQMLASITLPDGVQIEYAYDSFRNLIEVEYPDASARAYHYEINTPGSPQGNLLTGITDEAAQRYATYGYLGSVAASTEHAGGVNRYSFTSSGSNRTVTDPLGVARVHNSQVRYGARRYTSSPSSCDGCSESKSVQYDLKGNVSASTDFNNIETRYTYDLSRSLETSRVEAYGTLLARTIATQWHPAYRTPTQVDEPGKRTTFTHDANGNVLTRTELDTSTSVSRTWAYTYNNFGQVLTADGPRTDVSDVTTYAYYTCTAGYQCGQVHTIVNAAGHVTTYNAYNAHGQPLTITNSNAVVATLTYDLRQRLTSRTVDTEVTTFEYWPTGLLKKATLPDGSFLEYVYDAAHRLTDINDADGNRIHYTLDAMSNRTSEQAYDPSNALTRTRTRVFNTLNRLYQEIGAAGTINVTSTYGYDSNGNQTSIAAPLGRDTAQGYDELNRLTSVTDPLNGITQYGYNALDQLISVTDPRGLVTSYTYNALGDLQLQTSPDTGVTTNTYDSGGNLATSTDARNAIATYTYDELNRVATAAFSTGSTIDQALAYTYDVGTYGKGHLTGVSDSNHSLAWAYDEQGRVLTATQAVGSISKATSYTYAHGLRQSMTTPSGQVVTYGYTNGKITSVSVNGTVVVSNILYDPFGPVRQWAWGDGSLAVRTFDPDGKIAQIDSAGLKTYSYDDAFRITGITDTTNSSLSWAYGYDDLDRLISASKAGTTLGYTYDANGNRLTEAGSNPSTFTIAANSNRLSSTSGALARTYSYDAAGNTASFTGVSFTYNNRGRMKSSTKSGTTTNYTYNALGQLIKKGASTLYYYDEAGHLLGSYDASGVLIEEIVWLGDTPVVSVRPKSGGGTSLYNIHTDHLNTPRVITGSASGAVRWRWDGEPFGGGTVNNNPAGAGAFEFHLRFPGQMVIPETGLYYNYFRDYDASTGRYVESDPIGLQGGINTYAYALSNPIRNVDSKGLWSTADLALAGHFYSRRGGYVDISAWCGDYIADPMMKVQVQILKQKIDAAAQQLTSLKGSTTFSIQQRASLYISTIYSFGAGDGHVQTADCAAEGDGCCVNVNCKLRMYAVDGYDDPLDLCQRYGICGPVRNVGGTPFTFGLTCFSQYSARACRR